MDDSRGKILIVDDEAAIRKVISQKLERDGYECVLAADGEEALEKVCSHDFDLVLLDIRMPGLSGIEVLPQMTFERPDICVVMSTAVDDTQTTAQAMNLGAYDYVLKPFDLEDLATRIETALERRKVELDKRARAARHFSALVENIADSVFEFKRGTIAWCNRKAEEMLGYGHGELIGKEVEALLPGVARQIESAGGAGERLRGTTTLETKDGSVLHIEYSVSPIDGKETAEVVAVLRDITERKEAEEQLRVAEEKYRTIFENSAVAITMADENERVVLWNGYAEALLGMSANDLEASPVSSLYPDDEWQKIRSQNVRQKGMQHHIETRMLKGNEGTIDVDLSVSVLKGPGGEVTGSIAVISDITELKRLQEERDRLLRAVQDREQ
jgi:PAS domain S-box-containing protein